MSNDRRRQRARRRRTAPIEGGSSRVELPGVFGWFQRNGRLFSVLGIVVMVLSLGAVFISTQAANSGNDDPATTPSASPTATAESSATPEASTTPESSATPEATPTSEDAIQRVYAAPPEMSLDPGKVYQAVIRTEKGDVRVELYPEKAPIAVNNFVFLAKNRFYDGLTFHRVEPGFVAQAGDPTASGNGGPGYWLPDETNDLTFEAGTLAMAKNSTSVSGSQFFITLGDQPSLNGNFTVFGRVIEGMDVLQALTPRPLDATGGVPGDLILSIEIAEADAPAAQGGE